MGLPPTTPWTESYSLERPVLRLCLPCHCLYPMEGNSLIMIRWRVSESHLFLLQLLILMGMFIFYSQRFVYSYLIDKAIFSEFLKQFFFSLDNFSFFKFIETNIIVYKKSMQNNRHFHKFSLTKTLFFQIHAYIINDRYVDIISNAYIV